MEKKQEAFEASVKRYAIAGILGLAAAILLYQNADSIRPKLQSLGTLTTADVQKAASDAWKDTTVQFGKATAYLSSLLN